MQASSGSMPASRRRSARGGFSVPRLKITRFGRLRMMRNCIGIAGMLALSAFMAQTPMSTLGLLMTALLALGLFMAVSFINRYIFFVSVVPRNIPGNYLIAATESAH